MTRKAVFLDRDGTLNVDKDYVFKREDWEWIPGSVDALKELGKLNYLRIVITNQSAVERGYYSENDVRALHEFVNRDLSTQGAAIDGFYFCPHGPEDEVEKGGVCDCRKPAPGLILKAAQEHGIDMTASYMIGDKAIDMAAARAAGVKGILVLTGHGSEERLRNPRATPVVENLKAAVEMIKKGTS
jgi:D-glycero-D-manno-heptose 1,7-bisphosphate phosphatase